VLDGCLIGDDYEHQTIFSIAVLCRLVMMW
jgi:hypothetical protein